MNDVTVYGKFQDLYAMGFEDGFQFHHEFNFQPWWTEEQLIAYYRGWSDGKEKMIDEVRGKK